MIRIQLPDASEATFEAGRWQTNDSRLEQLLNAMRCPWLCDDAEMYEANVVTKVLGATIIEHVY